MPTLFDIFGDFSKVFPKCTLQPMTGVLATSPKVSAWLGNLNNGVVASDVHTGAFGDRVTIAAKLQIDNAKTGYAGGGGFPFVFASMPDVEFRIQPLDKNNYSQLFVSISDKGVEIVLEGLPVEIRLPLGLVEMADADDIKKQKPIDERVIGKFSPKNIDSLEIRYRRGDVSSVFVHVRLHMDEDGYFAIRPAVPISFGPCKLMGLPCKAIHDFQLVPSPVRAENDLEWLRHGIEAWLDSMKGMLDGCWAVRSVHFDQSKPPLASLSKAMNKAAEQPGKSTTTISVKPTYGQKPSNKAEFVLDDFVVPFYSPWALPIPRHITTGLRRLILDPASKEEMFRLKNAPVYAYIRRDSNVAFIIESLFFRSKVPTSSDPDIGISFAAGIAWGKGKSDKPDLNQQAVLLELGEQYNLRATYRRKFDSTTGDPKPESTWDKFLNALLHWEIADNDIDVMAIRSGYAIGRAVGEGAGFGDCFEFTVDLYVSMGRTGSKFSWFRLRGLSGEKVKFKLEALGWRQGSFHADIALPDGVIAYFGSLAIVIEEIGLLQEGQATYFSFSGGFMWQPPSSMSGGMIFRRLRFRVSGSKDEPPFKIDGIFAFLTGPTFIIDVGGYFTDKLLPDESRIKEFGMTGTLYLELKVIKFLVALDLIIGEITHPQNDDFDYFMFQIYFQGVIPVYGLEVAMIRVLYADDMIPKLQAVAPESREQRYFNWYRSSNPLNVPGSRRLAAWKPENHAMSLGIGFGAGLTGLSKLVSLNFFVLGVTSRTEHGLLYVFEVLALGNNSPIAYGSLEFDLANDRWSLVIGVELTLKSFVKDTPDWLDSIAKLTGTLYIGNQPATFAIGRLADQRTWLTLKFKWDYLLSAEFSVGLCVEIVDGGPNGFGFFLRAAGGFGAGIIRMEYYVGMGLVYGSFSSGSTDFSAAFYIEGCFRILLFGFLRFGISVRIDSRSTGSNPRYGELSITFRLETPWFLPDVTWKASKTIGVIEPAAYSALTTPLRRAALTANATEKTAEPHIERVDNTWDGEGSAHTFSIDKLRKIGKESEAKRVARFVKAPIKPMATDARVSFTFNVPVNDRLGFSGVEFVSNAGDQAAGYPKSNALTSSYELIGITVKRRPRFDASLPWKTLQEHFEIRPDFSDPTGVSLSSGSGFSGGFKAQTLKLSWDIDMKVGGKPATKKLLLNATTPFEFITENPVGDEALVEDNPAYPCCPPPEKWSEMYYVNFRAEALGATIHKHLFINDKSTLGLYVPAQVLVQRLGSGIPVDACVADIAPRPGRLFTVNFNETAAFVFVRMAWAQGSAKQRILLVGYSELYEEVARTDIPLAGSSGFHTHVLAAQGDMNRMEAWLIGGGGNTEREWLTIELDEIRYTPLSAYLNKLRNQYKCAESNTDDFRNAYEGQGKVGFLPNHEYGVALKLRMTVRHPSKPAISTEVSEHVYFKTKGLSGLNAVERVGEETEPYVESTYTGGRGVLYRKEPVVLHFNEDFYTAVPLFLRPPGSADEQTTLLEMQLTVKPDNATYSATVFTTTTPDWIVEHRPLVSIAYDSAWKPNVSLSTTIGTTFISSDPYRTRLASLTQRPEVHCALNDPREVVGTALIAYPQGEPDSDNPTRQLWEAGSRFTATVRAKDGPFIDRSFFIAADKKAFTFWTNDGSLDNGAWTIVDQTLRVSGSNRRFAAFGDADWDHLVIEVGIDLSGTEAGIGVALPASGASCGLFATIKRSGSQLHLVIHRRGTGTQFKELKSATLPDTVDEHAIPLIVTVFDDYLRASVGETHIEVAREEYRQGRACLVAHGEVNFSRLHVRGLDMYQFQFAVSRYKSFTAHIKSYDGTMDICKPNALGAGTTTKSSSALWSSTRSKIQQVMTPSASDTERQKVFDTWLSTLGVPLKDEVTRLELSRFLYKGKTELILTESPEPIDFAEEVSLTMTQRTFVRVPKETSGPSNPWRRDLSKVRVADKSRGRESYLTELDNRREALLRDLLSETGVSEYSGLGLNLPVPPAESRSVIENAAREGTRLVVQLNQDAIREFCPAALLGFVQIKDKKSGTFHVSMVSIRQLPDSDPLSMNTDDAVEYHEDDFSPEVRDSLEKMTSRDVIVLDERLSTLLDFYVLRTFYVNVKTVVLQDASRKHAIIIPVDGANHKALECARYRLHFHLNRSRWKTLDSVDNINHYEDSAILTVDL